jgi:hypothetical protein
MLRRGVALSGLPSTESGVWVVSIEVFLRAKDCFMGRKPLNRLDLRRQREAAEPLDPMEDEAEEAVEEVEEEEVPDKKPKKKPRAPAKSRAKSARSSKPAARVRIVWTVLNDAFKPVGTFDYTQKEAAEARAAELTAKGKGTHFVQRTKEPMPEDAPGLGAAIPRATAPTPKVSKKAAAAAAAAAAAVEDEEEVEEEEDEVDVAEEADDDEE